MSLLLKNISLPLAPFTLEVDVELRGRSTVIFGPSGAGKTSLLELIAGLRRANSALIELDGRVLTNTAQNISVPTHERGVGYVPQDLALFPHLSVKQNLLYGAKSNGGANNLSFERVVKVLEIQALIGRGVTELSGGEKQRVALARALLASPRLLLLDEPLSSLNLDLKTRILPCLVRIRDEFGVPILYVTHDRHETLALADEMLVLLGGKVAQLGSVREIFSRPTNVAVANLLTVETIQPGCIIKRADGLISILVGKSTVTAAEQHLPANTTDVYVCIRAEDVILIRGDEITSSARNRLAGVVEAVSQEGAQVRVELDCGFPLTVLLTKQASEELALKPGAQIVALIKAPHLHLIPR